MATIRDRKAIEAVNAKFGEAVRKGDGAAIAGLYAENAKLLPPNGEMIQGREGIQAFWSGGIKMGIKDAILTTVEILGTGNLVCEVGTYDLTINLEGRGIVKDMGKYLVVWKRSAKEGWRLLADIWNTNQPSK